ncbi:hypothetical protein JMJ77_0000327 [Colletotrichum scovillei]|uniref:Uncharacterized protein n=1 Tax=Colletotrichum scovillei TaxID=1209932 RepID=A0A9P7R984_9PEZI|nr:hypothetical protein JMJ77_0000327 [Colletotrichum scovillei]KAG7071533.1 hypothetical protein JMJ76_0004404 [Colletotrichum scovillei]KAG7079781.1 hypothetical protein JMJ78_0006885 [Colletotrichum scovillei]
MGGLWAWLLFQAVPSNASTLGHSGESQHLQSKRHFTLTRSGSYHATLAAIPLSLPGRALYIS